MVDVRIAAHAFLQSYIHICGVCARRLHLGLGSIAIFHGLNHGLTHVNSVIIYHYAQLQFQSCEHPGGVCRVSTLTSAFHVWAEQNRVLSVKLAAAGG